MPSNDVFTRNDDGDLAVRTVSATESSTVVNPNDVYTRDTDGNLAVRVVGGSGGGDSHNKGYFATPEALRTAYPTAEAGDFAIVESTDTVWVWDSDTSAWKDSDQKGQVTSVNNQTGDVTVQETLVSGTNIKTINGNSVLGAGNLELSTYLTYPSGWTTTGTTKAFCDDIAADSSAVEGKVYLGEVTLSDLPASMANGEIVVEIMSGTTAQTKIIVLTLTSGNTAPYMWKYTYWDNGTNVSGWKTWQEPLVSGANIKTVNNTSLLGSGNITIDSLPTQSGNSGKFLTTDGSSASWATVDALPTQTGQNGKFLTTNGSDASWADVDSLPTQTGNAGKFLQTDGTDASWQNAAQISQPSTMPTLVVADWALDSGTNKYTQTVNVSVVTASNVVFVSPAPASADEYASCGVICISQGAGTLTFQADSVPASDITVNVVTF